MYQCTVKAILMLKAAPQENSLTKVVSQAVPKVLVLESTIASVHSLMKNLSSKTVCSRPKVFKIKPSMSRDSELSAFGLLNLSKRMEERSQQLSSITLPFTTQMV